MKRFTKDEILKLIEDSKVYYDCSAPSFPQIVKLYNSQIENTNNDFSINGDIIRYYVLQYDLKDLVFIRKRTNKKKE